MSVPPERMVARNPRPTGDPNKIMGVSKPVFWVIIVVGVVLAFYMVKRSKNAAANTAAEAPSAPQDMSSFPTDGGLVSAGLPNVPGTNANTNPYSNPSGQGGDSTFTQTFTNPITADTPVSVSYLPPSQPITYVAPIGAPATQPVYGSPIPPAYNPVTAPIRSRFS